MVVCCVPRCFTDSLKCDPSITFHDFPTNPDLAAKWITQINTLSHKVGMWFPRGTSSVCSKHFTESDFKPDSAALKPRSVPTVFGLHRIGIPSTTAIEKKRKCEFTSSPLIVKVLKPSEIRHNNHKTSSISTNPGTQKQQARKNLTSIATSIPSSPTNDLIYTQSPKTVSVSPTIQDVFSIKSLRDQISNVLKPNTTPNMCRSISDQLKQTSVFKATSPNSSICKRQPVKQFSNVLKKTPERPINKTPQKSPYSPYKRIDKVGSDLIEIGPNTFLKINPDIIKVNKKQTPSGNTVLQFLMNQKLAMSQADNILPKLIQNASPSVHLSPNSKSAYNQAEVAKKPQKDVEVQHVLGHIVDTHICKKSCSDLQDDLDSEFAKEKGSTGKVGNPNDTESKTEDSNEQHIVNIADSPLKEPSDDDHVVSNDDDSACIAKAPILLTTNVPFSHYFNDKNKYNTLMRQKARQVTAMKQKITKLTQKVEELEDKCIVQERQLSYSFIKRIKTIRKYAKRGDPAANYILEQIRGYGGKNTKTRWSDTTLTQCAIWCRKAPYAYEYFKRAKFFQLPCLGTVKRYIKSHPDMKFVSKPNTNTMNPEDDGSSSDFDFDETDSGASDKGEEESIACETILTLPSEASRHSVEFERNSEDSQLTRDIANSSAMRLDDHNTVTNMESNDATENQATVSEHRSQNIDAGEEIPIEVDRSDLEIQELILPSGEVVQCISSALCDKQDGNQYYIIPTVNDQSDADHQYSIVSTDSIILQNIENSELTGDQQELIFITNSAEQVECSQTEVTSA